VSGKETYSDREKVEKGKRLWEGIKKDKKVSKEGLILGSKSEHRDKGYKPGRNQKKGIPVTGLAREHELLVSRGFVQLLAVHGLKVEYGCSPKTRALVLYVYG
jgi:hypothetical protein